VYCLTLFSPPLNSAMKRVCLILAVFPSACGAGAGASRAEVPFKSHVPHPSMGSLYAALSLPLMYGASLYSVACVVVLSARGAGAGAPGAAVRGGLCHLRALEVLRSMPGASMSGISGRTLYREPSHSVCSIADDHRRHPLDWGAALNAAPSLGVCENNSGGVRRPLSSSSTGSPTLPGGST
jgi:hypothetical protein